MVPVHCGCRSLRRLRRFGNDLSFEREGIPASRPTYQSHSGVAPPKHTSSIIFSTDAIRRTTTGTQIAVDKSEKLNILTKHPSNPIMKAPFGSCRYLWMTCALTFFQLWQLSEHADTRTINPPIGKALDKQVKVTLTAIMPIDTNRITVNEDIALDTGYGQVDCVKTHLQETTLTIPFLPVGIIAGTMKAGTQSLMKFLLQHPQIATHQPSEMHVLANPRFFRPGRVDVASVYAKYQDIYRSTIIEQNKETMVLIDKSPEYLLESHVVPQRVVCVFGNATKVVMVLRNPVDRTISNYYHKRRSFQARKSQPDPTHRNSHVAFPTLEEMIQQQLDVLGPLGLLNTTHWTPRQEYQAWSRFHRSSNRFDPSGRSQDETNYGIVARSLYNIQLRQWLAVFRDAFGSQEMWKHLLIIESEQLQARKEVTYQRILEFLGLSPFHLMDATDQHKGNYYNLVSDETQQWLKRIYAASNQQLRDLLKPYGMELSWK